MSDVTCEIVEHDGGWDYRVDGAFSEPFLTHSQARAAAARAAGEQRVSGETTGIPWEDADGHLHDELSAGNAGPRQM
jgi:hypothetical protein